MSMYRVADPSLEIEAEGEKLFDQWTENDESLTWRDYLLKYASQEALAYMREIEEAQEYAEKNDVMI